MVMNIPSTITAFFTFCAVVFALPAEAVTQKKKTAISVAVLYFDYEGNTKQMGHLRKGLAQMLVSDLTNIPGVEIVERTRLEDALRELKLNRTAKIDRKTANRMGRLIGAKYLVMGGYFDFGKTLRIDTRIVEVETGKIVGSFGASSGLDEFLSLEQKLATRLGEMLGAIPRVQKSRARKTTRRSTKKPTKPTTKQPTTATTKKPKKPAKLTASLVAQYGEALHALDSGHKKQAKDKLTQVLKQSPDFTLAAIDLANLAQ